VASVRCAADVAARSILLRNTEALKVEWSEFSCIIGEDADLLIRRKPGEDRRDLKQRGGGNGDG
jgi:hypothetical protein